MYNIHTLYSTEERQFLCDNCVQPYVGRILRVFIYQWQFTPVFAQRAQELCESGSGLPRR